MNNSYREHNEQNNPVFLHASTSLCYPDLKIYLITPAYDTWTWVWVHKEILKEQKDQIDIWR